MSRLRDFDSIFGKEDIASDPRNQISQIRLCDLVFYEDQKNPMRTDEELCSMAESIRSKGVLEPIIVRPRPATTQKSYDHYQVLNGRHRTRASQLAGLDDVPAVVVEADDEEALYIVATTTIDQCHELSPSVKAWAYRVKMETEQRQGQRSDLLKSADNLGHRTVESNFLHNVQEVTTASEIAFSAKVSPRTIAYYIRLTYLVQELSKMVDAGQLPIRAGAELSYLPEDSQLVVHAYITEHRKKLTVEQAENIREYGADMGVVTQLTLDKLFGCTPISPNASRSIRFAKKDLVKIVNCIPAAQVNQATEYVIKALRYYKECVGG